MTTKSVSAAPAPAPTMFGVGFDWPTAPAMSAMPSVPWELAIQALTLQSSFWMACAAMQSRWMGDALASMAELPTWMVWHNGTEQLA